MQNSQGKQKQLPNMPSPISDAQILELPDSVIAWIQDFCDGKHEFVHYGDIQLSYRTVVSTLSTTKVSDPLVIKTAGRYLSQAASAFVSYIELQNAARK